MWGRLTLRVMKWDEPPLWPVAVPSMAGFAAACLPYLVNDPRFIEGSLLASFLVLLALSPAILRAPVGNASRLELLVGTWVGMLLCFLPQLIFFVWFIPVVLFWVAQSTYIWKRNYPPFRVGIWLGSGAVSGLFTGGIFAHFFL